MNPVYVLNYIFFFFILVLKSTLKFKEVNQLYSGKNMNNLSPQEEMIQLITNCISSNDFETAKNV